MPSEGASKGFSKKIKKLTENNNTYFLSGGAETHLSVLKNQNDWLIYIKILFESYYSKRFYLRLGRIPVSLSKVLEHHSDTLYYKEYLSRKPPILFAIFVKRLINFRPSKHVSFKVRNTWNKNTGSTSYHYVCFFFDSTFVNRYKSLHWASLRISSVMASCLFLVKVNYNEDF